jgi:hypothetical protein
MRYYTETTKEHFLSKVQELMENEEFPFEQNTQLFKDLSKVRFDYENCTGFGDVNNYATYPVGYKEIAPGFHVYFVNAGGDWEYPICYIYYWGQGRLRAYIPENGNAWNKKEKCAYGSDSDENSGDEDHGFEINEELMIAEILEHIQKK